MKSLDHLSQADREEVEQWDWTAIGRTEAEVRSRMLRLSSCSECGGSLCCGQVKSHFSCRKADT